MWTGRGWREDVAIIELPSISMSQKLVETRNCHEVGILAFH
jgi:hypothetical protein